MPRVIVLLPTLIFAAWGIKELAAENPVPPQGMPDLLIYREGAILGWRGETPYSSKIRDAVAARWPEDEKLIRNCGYFLPPMAIVVAGPFAALPWESAKLLYVILSLASFVACWYGLTFAFRNRAPPKLEDVPLLLPWLIVLHPILRIAFDVGQTTVLAVGAIVLGQILHERKRPVLGALLWACAFVKPHVALPLLPLALYLSGWRRAAWIALWVVALNLIGCLLAGGSPLFGFDYLRKLGAAHQQVEFNRVGLNPQIMSWNRIVVSLGGPEIAFTIWHTLASYGIVAALIVMRCAIARCWPSPAWALAMAVTAAMLCCQVMVYEAFLLVLCVPYLLECWSRRQWIDFAAVALLLMTQTNSLDGMFATGKWLDRQFGTDFLFLPLWFSYRPWLNLFTVLWLLARPQRRLDDPLLNQTRGT